jgi:hypothetical protein
MRLFGPIVVNPQVAHSSTMHRPRPTAPKRNINARMSSADSTKIKPGCAERAERLPKNDRVDPHLNPVQIQLRNRCWWIIPSAGYPVMWVPRAVVGTIREGPHPHPVYAAELEHAPPSWQSGRSVVSFKTGLVRAPSLGLS